MTEHKLVEQEALINQSQLLLDQAKIEKARKSFIHFCEYVIKDESTGNKIKLAELQKTWIYHIAFCKKYSLNALILAPMSSGKTQIISVGLPLYLLGRNPNTRIKLVCLSDDSAKERVSSIRGYIEEDADYSKVFPGIKPGDKKEWTRHKLVVDRQTYAKDTSIDAKGIVASAIGGRADVLIVDDIFDQRTAVSQPATREQYLATYTQVWLSRVEPNGRVVCICTRWHEQDLAGYVMANPSMMNSYGILIQRVADDFSGINCEVHIPDKLTDYYRKENPLVYTTVDS